MTISLGQKYGFSLESPEPTEEEVNGADYILIRHGTSVFNFEAAQTVEKYGADSKEFSALKADRNGFDPELHEFGIL